MAERNYWGYRIDKTHIDYFWEELKDGRLRQGWGWLAGQDLRNMTDDYGAKRNLQMYKKVKKGDILLVPQLPNWGKVAIVEATEDWNKGYYYEIDKVQEDYGHIFPAKYIKSFKRTNENISGDIRSTLRNPLRFWNINHYGEDIEKVLKIPEEELIEVQDYRERIDSTVGSVFNETFDNSSFKVKLKEKLDKQFTAKEWEYVLYYGIKEIFPYYQVEIVGNKKEERHGTDILVKIPSVLPDYEYGIAIQVKDYEGLVNNDVIKQINKADGYWDSENIKLIDKVIIIVGGKKEINENLVNNAGDVKIIFANELEELLNQMGKSFIGINPYYNDF